MPKFSIIIPVYNVEEYIQECLESVMNQSFKDYEVIVVDDGTKDHSIEKIKDYKVEIIHQENQGLSMARNNGAKKAKGEYILFVDSDDTIEKDLLKKLNEATTTKPDLVRYQIREVYEDHQEDHEEEGFDTCSGQEAFTKICKYHIVEAAPLYAMKRSYWEKEKYQFAKGKYHEDFGLVPLIILKAKEVISIPYIGYNYRQRSNSIMSTVDYEKVKKKAYDFLDHYRYLMKEIKDVKEDTTIFRSFIANSVIEKGTELKGKDYQEYKRELKQEKVLDQILTDSLPRIIKKVLLKISPKLYFKMK